MEKSGIRPERLQLEWISAAEGIRFANTMIGSPDINEVILPGDVLMAIGNRDQTKSLDNMCKL
jgi:uncharacterized protein with PhoU and TrkA domain